MKKILTIISLLLISACGDGKCEIMKAPTNAKMCHNDGECNGGEYCGFYGVDTAPVCKPYHPAITWTVPR